MAYTKKDSNVTSKQETESVDTTATTKKKVKTFSPDDMIPCVSVTPGEMFFIGPKTKELYVFADINDVVEIAYKDLDYASKSRNTMMYKPRFVVQDEDFVQKHKALDKVYSSLYSIKDLKSILNMDARSMETTINSLPESVKDSLKTLAATMIDNGTLDSISRIKKLDSIFDTQMILKLTT